MRCKPRDNHHIKVKRVKIIDDYMCISFILAY